MQVNILRFKFWTLASLIFSATKRNFPARIRAPSHDCIFAEYKTVKKRIPSKIRLKTNRSQAAIPVTDTRFRGLETHSNARQWIFISWVYSNF